LLDHSFNTADLKLSGMAADFQGMIRMPCNASTPEEWSACVNSPVYAPVPYIGSDRLKEIPSAFGIDAGDVISLGDILKMSHPQGKTLLDMKRHMKNQQIVRENGAVIVMTISYTNKAFLDPLGKAPIHYQISAAMLPMNEYKKMYGEVNEKGRVVTNVHGIALVMTVHGVLHEFCISYMLTVLTTSLVLLSSAAVIVDSIMMYVLPSKAKYSILKYQLSQDFSKVLKDATIAKELQKKVHGHQQHLVDCITEEGKHVFPSPLLEEESTLLLNYLVKVEQRLNRIDGFDEHFINTAPQDDDPHDRLHKYLKNAEDIHEKEVLKIDRKGNEGVKEEDSTRLLESPRGKE